MAFREGDTLALRAQCVVKLSQYESLKPWASLTRVLGEDPEADAEDMRRTLYVELRRAVLMEIEDRDAAQALVGERGQLTALIKHCEKVIEEGPDGEEASKGVEFPRRKDHQAKGHTTARKAKGRKVARKARKRSQA
jgi:hypothetical protein